jgi:hypothetical protein
MFLHPDNQKLLWNLINQNTVFIEKPLKEREHIFKNAMQVIYNDNVECVNDRNRLNELNKSVIYLIKTWIQKVHSPSSHTGDSSNSPPASNFPTNSFGRSPENWSSPSLRSGESLNSFTGFDPVSPAVPNPKMNFSERSIDNFRASPERSEGGHQFAVTGNGNSDESRKYVYNDPYPKPNIKPEDIMQKIEDKPIQNIDELIQKQMMEREQVNVFRNENHDGKSAGRYEGLEDIIRKVIDDFYEKNMKKDFDNLKNEINIIKNYIKSDENTN